MEKEEGIKGQEKKKNEAVGRGSGGYGGGAEEGGGWSRRRLQLGHELLPPLGLGHRHVLVHERLRLRTRGAAVNSAAANELHVGTSRHKTLPSEAEGKEQLIRDEGRWEWRGGAPFGPWMLPFSRRPRGEGGAPPPRCGACCLLPGLYLKECGAV